eukprot:NODE_465_length_7087_cov_1.060962.p2 type:complete len:612 gc:universal NODE_465_length_7087_cov_1.060962:1018-2853(+)
MDHEIGEANMQIGKLQAKIDHIDNLLKTKFENWDHEDKEYYETKRRIQLTEKQAQLRNIKTHWISQLNFLNNHRDKLAIINCTNTYINFDYITFEEKVYKKPKLARHQDVALSCLHFGDLIPSTNLTFPLTENIKSSIINNYPKYCIYESIFDPNIRKLSILIGGWNYGKTTTLSIIKDLAIESKKIVFYIENGLTYVDFAVNKIFYKMNEQSISYWEAVIQKKSLSQMAKVVEFLASLKKLNNNYDILELLVNIKSIIPVFIIVDCWDKLQSAHRSLHNTLEPEFTYFIAGTGNWDPLSCYERLSDNLLSNYYINIDKFTQLTDLKTKYDLDKAEIIEMTNGIPGLVYLVRNSNSVFNAKIIVKRFYEMKIEKLVFQFLTARRHAELDELINMANFSDFKPTFDFTRKWHHEGLLDKDFKFSHKEIKFALNSIAKTYDIVESIISCYLNYQNEALALEYFFDYVFQNGNSLILTKKKHLEEPVILRWYGLTYFHKEGKQSNYIYKVQNNYPDYKYYCIQEKTIYAIQISVLFDDLNHQTSASYNNRAINEIELSEEFLENQVNNSDEYTLEHVFLCKNYNRQIKTGHDFYFPLKENYLALLSPNLSKNFK